MEKLVDLGGVCILINNVNVKAVTVHCAGGY